MPQAGPSIFGSAFPGRVETRFGYRTLKPQGMFIIAALVELQGQY